MPKRKTWVWILVSIAGVSFVAIVVIAIAGIMFVTRHVTTTKASAADAERAFDAARTQFKDARPLIELDQNERPRLSRPLAEVPTSPVKPQYLWVLVFDYRDERLVKVSLPFWLLRMGRRKIDVGGDQGFDLDRLNLDVKELERIGSTLVLDHRAASGERVLVWTQ
jgi:hypothetical protein